MDQLLGHTPFDRRFDGLRTQLRMLPLTLITGDSFAPPCTNYDAERGLGRELCPNGSPLVRKSKTASVCALAVSVLLH